MRFGLKVVTWITLMAFSIPALAQSPSPSPSPSPAPATPINPYPAPTPQSPAPPPQQPQYPYPYPPPAYNYPPNYYAPPPQYPYPYPYPPPAYNYPPNYYAPPPQQPAPPPQAPAQPMPELLAPVERPAPPPRPVRYELRRNWGMFIGGLVLFDITWNISMTAGYFSGTPHLYIPVVGPFLITNDLLHQNCATAYNGVVTASYECSVSAGDRAAATALIFDGLGQAAGLAMMIAGVLTKSRQPVREQRVTVLPTGLGAAVLGKF